MCELGSSTVVNAFEVFRDECVKQVNVYGYNGCRARKKKEDICDAAEHIRDKFLRKTMVLLTVLTLNSLGFQYSAN